MSGISGLTDSQKLVYNQLIETGSKEHVTQATIDRQLQEAMAAGLKFDDAVTQVKSDLPNLKIPVFLESGTLKSNLEGLPSFGANYMAMITDVASEQRRQNAEMRALQTEEMIDKIQDQAAELRSRAVTQLVMGIVSGTLSIAQGVMSAAMTIKGSANVEQKAQSAKMQTIEQGTGGGTKPLTGKQMNTLLTESNKAYSSVQQTESMLLNTKIGMFNSCAGGVTGMVGSIGQALTTFSEAKMKDLEGDVERIRAAKENLQSLDDNLNTVIQKALATMDTIQQNINQTRTKILG